MLGNEIYFDSLDGEAFELYLKEIFEHMGYTVETTLATGDYGADLVLYGDNKKIVVQAKRYSDKVGPKAVQEVIGAKYYYKADAAMVVTNNYFTPNAVELAESADVRLWNRDMLIKRTINHLSAPQKIIKEYNIVSLDYCIDLLRKVYRSDIELILGLDNQDNIIQKSLKELNSIIMYGPTGSGKTCLLYNLLIQFFAQSNSEYRFIIIDDKGFEYDAFDDAGNLLVPVIKNPKKAIGVFGWLVREIYQRFDLFISAKVRDLDGYNTQIEPIKRLPRLVVFIDELTYLYNQDDKEISEYIHQILLKGRQAGVQLVAATLDKSLFNKLQSNFPTKIEFVNIYEDDKGNTVRFIKFMELFSNKAEMIKIPFIQPDKISEYVNTHKMIFEYFDEGNERINGFFDLDKIQSSTPIDANDEFLKDAIEFAILKDRISASMLQRQFRLGYNRASKLIDVMHEMGIIGPEDSAKPRKVLVTLEEIKADEEKITDEEEKTTVDICDQKNEIFNDVVDLVTSKQKVSVSMLQKHFNINYACAINLMEAMEKLGIIGNKGIFTSLKKVLITKEEWEKMKENLE